MKIVRIEIRMSHKIYLGGYETIEPFVGLTADLDEGENLEEARKVVAAEAQKLWAKEVLEELRVVHRRRNGGIPPESDKLPELMTSMKAIVKEP